MAGFTLCGKALEQPEGSPVLRAEFHRRQVLPGRFRETALALLFLLRAMPIGQAVEFDPFVDRLIAEAGWTWPQTAMNNVRNRSVKEGDAIGGFGGWSKLAAFSLTGFGRMLLETLR
jgi:hypothetical protein